MIETILENQLAHLGVPVVKSYEKHVVLRVKVYLQGSTLLLEVGIEQLDLIEVR